MAVGIIMEFEGFSPDTYEAVREKINWPQDWPEGVSFHVAGPSGDGMRLVEIWESREQYDRWMQDTIQPALREVMGEEALASSSPPRVTEFEVRRQDSR